MLDPWDFGHGAIAVVTEVSSKERGRWGCEPVWLLGLTLCSCPSQIRVECEGGGVAVWQLQPGSEGLKLKSCMGNIDVVSGQGFEDSRWAAT